MGIKLSGNTFILDQESENQIVELSINALKSSHKEEYESNLSKFRGIVFKQEVARMKKYLETKHPEEVNMIFRLRAILNHERIG